MASPWIARGTHSSQTEPEKDDGVISIESHVNLDW